MRRQTIPDSKPRWLRQMVEPFTDTTGRPDPDPLLTMWLPAAPTSSTSSPVRTQRDADPERADTDPGHRTSTPGHWTTDRGHRIADTGRSHRTPDTWTRPSTRTGRPRHRRHPGQTSWTITTTRRPVGTPNPDLWSAPSTLGDGEVPASARLPTTLQAPARSLRRPGQAAPWRIALLRRIRVERRTGGDASSVMTSGYEPAQVIATGGVRLGRMGWFDWGCPRRANSVSVVWVDGVWVGDRP
jgi:hypothetical protein